METPVPDSILDTLPKETIARLHALLDEVLRVNQQFNLTAIRDPQEAWIKHILDSVQGLRTGLFEGTRRVIDVGAGAGFPGLALAVARPELKVLSLDATRKKCDFMRDTAHLLSLNAPVVCARAEKAAHEAPHRERFDLATARAVGSLSEVCELALPFVRVGGHLVLWRGFNAVKELSEAQRALKSLGGASKTAPLPYSLPGHDLTYHLTVIEKMKPTPREFPRRDGLPKSQPL
jgi:16S rRNA (guanine527-N7)-methyltransferase